MTEKQALRQEVSARLSGLTIPSAAIGDKLMPLIPPGASLFCFVGSEGEVDTLPLLELWLSQGRAVAAPLWFPGGIMEPRRIFSLADLQKSPRGFYRPLKTAPVLSHPDIAIVPGLCFDRRGYRLGRGGGYYDRFLAGFAGLSIGLCPDALLVDSLPVEPHDRQVDIVVTESLVLRSLTQSI